MQLNLTETRLAELWELARSKQAEGENGLQRQLTPDELLVFGQYSAMHGSLVLPWLSAPIEAVELAKAIMPHSKRTFSIARLVQPRPLLGFARGAISQIQFESEEIQVRIQLEEIPNGWRLWGRTSETGWSVWSGQSSVECNEDGEFELDVQTESVEPLSLQNETMIILLPFSGNGDA